MKTHIVKTSQVSALSEKIEALQTAPRSDLRLAVVVGPPGSGKSTAMRAAAAACPETVAVRLDSLTTAKSLLTATLYALQGWHIDAHGVRPLFERLVEDLLRLAAARPERRPVILFDESDNLLRGDRFNLVDLVRDLSDVASVPIVMFSVRELGARLLRPNAYVAETFRSRLAFRLEFERPSLTDARLLASELSEVALDRDLTELCWTRSGASLRSLLEEYREIEHVARAAGLARINLAQWKELQAIIAGSAELHPKRAKLARAVGRPASLEGQKGAAALRRPRQPRSPRVNACSPRGNARRCCSFARKRCGNGGAAASGRPTGG